MCKILLFSFLFVWQLKPSEFFQAKFPLLNWAPGRALGGGEGGELHQILALGGGSLDRRGPAL